ncbi:glycine/sarcosine N-methyltransferase [Candidatus Nitrotoga sp. M5]|uniref:glycine/sarcosine N-methyltransferase n=1 Tax=Candidatus Nitrotoga sp. M5 TaxID=2890409 RepID=UPI001EF2CEA7|nr:class I SAM-dependent methyltransferase [Candidatus Nitrotoga sp. M5]CAH1385878.1 Glycine/sarcosine N-methyltransferase [Candidatus Nitrotoga sp. M5]
MSGQSERPSAESNDSNLAKNEVVPLHESPKHQVYGEDPTQDRSTDHYQAEYVENFVERWDELIDWDARTEGEGQFFIDKLRALGKEKILDVATGTGFHSVQLIKAGFNVTSVDGSAQMLVKAFDNAQKRGYVLTTVHGDWRWLNRDVEDQQFDAVICLGNSFTHLFEEHDRRRALAEFYSVLKHDGILILDQRNYDSILDNGFSTKHKYYYCGERVSAKPIYMDDGLARFEYSFEDGSKHHLNMFPLRKDYTRKLISDAGFQKIETFGDFKETQPGQDPDFFVHIAYKAYDAE